MYISWCQDSEDKGLGAFAKESIKAGDLVGVYWGERLTKRQLMVRHGWNLSWMLRPDESSITKLEATQRKSRETRISCYMPGHLSLGCPEGGDENGGKYVFMLRIYAYRARLLDIVCVDGEDPTRSSWCRYINNAPAHKSNLHARASSREMLVWFTAKRDIDCGEELTFNYADEETWVTWGRWLAVALGTAGLLSWAIFGVEVQSPLTLGADCRL